MTLKKESKMAKKRIEIKLTEEEQKTLEKYVSQGKRKAKEITRSRVLLLFSEGREIKDIEAYWFSLCRNS